MEKKLNKIIGITKQEFDDHIKFNQIQVRQARLIPTSKTGDEISLSSVLLKTLSMVKEFRKQILSDVQMMNSGKIHVYTEVRFPALFEGKDRPDGLILIEKNGIIVDAALVELKKGNSILELDQVERYTLIAKELAIPKLITVSNQFVNDPTQSPVGSKSTKNFSYFHLSWPYIRTLAHIMLNNDESIDDDDQRSVLFEVLQYLESDKCEICDSHQMKEGWVNVVNKIYSRVTLRSDDTDVKEAVSSWHQEEMDLALKLSKNLGVIVSSGETKYKENNQKRLDDDSKMLMTINMMASSLKVKGAASKLFINAFFDKRSVETYVVLKAPSDKKTKGQLGWLEKQLRDCNKKDEQGFNSLKNSLFIDVFYKNISRPERISIEKFLTAFEPEKDKEIREFGIALLRDFGKDFGHKTKFVENIANMSLEFYGRIVEHLRSYEAPAPKLSEDVIQSASVAVTEKSNPAIENPQDALENPKPVVPKTEEAA